MSGKTTVVPKETAILFLNWTLHGGFAPPLHGNLRGQEEDEAAAADEEEEEEEVRWSEWRALVALSSLLTPAISSSQ